MKIRDDVRKRLIEVAKSKKTITYGELMNEFHIPRGHLKHELGIGYIVGEISKFEHNEGRPMLSAIVIHKDGKSIGDGFYELARQLGLLTNQNEKDFWIQEQQKVWKCYE